MSKRKEGGREGGRREEKKRKEKTSERANASLRGSLGFADLLRSFADLAFAF